MHSEHLMNFTIYQNSQFCEKIVRKLLVCRIYFYGQLHYLLVMFVEMWLTQRVVLVNGVIVACRILY